MEVEQRINLSLDDIIKQNNKTSAPKSAAAGKPRVRGRGVEKTDAGKQKVITLDGSAANSSRQGRLCPLRTLIASGTAVQVGLKARAKPLGTAKVRVSNTGTYGQSS